MSFRQLLYRYFFFNWLFRDVSRGNQFERAAAWRHNQEQARWLPTYMKRWLVFGLLFYGLGALIEVGLSSPALSSLLYVPSVLSVPVNAVIVAAWAGLKTLSAPL
jgi:predicted metal-binding membrane protein